jgi:hypothetical protein
LKEFLKYERNLRSITVSETATHRTIWKYRGALGGENKNKTVTRC